MKNSSDRGIKLGIFGGAFNPIHNGHISIAEQCTAALNLDELWFVPCGTPPAKESLELLPGLVRLKLVEEAVKDTPVFKACTIEVKRGGVSYTVDTLEEILENEKLTPATLYLITGVDAFLSIESWRNYSRVFSLTNIVVVNRPGYPELKEIVSIAERAGFCYNNSITTVFKQDRKALKNKVVAKLKERQHDRDRDNSYFTCQSRKQFGAPENPDSKHKFNYISTFFREEGLPRMVAVWENKLKLQIIALECVPVPVSSSEIRTRIKAGLSIDDMVPQQIYPTLMEEYKSL